MPILPELFEPAPDSASPQDIDGGIVEQAYLGQADRMAAAFDGDPRETDRLLSPAAGVARRSGGALGALLRLQQDRRRLIGEQCGEQEAVGRTLAKALMAAKDAMPPSCSPAAAPSPGTQPAAPKLTRPPAPLPPSLAHLADAPTAPDAALEGPNAPPTYLPWEPGCDTPLWYTVHDNNLTDEQRKLRRVWLAGDRYCIQYPEAARLIRKHRGPPPDCTFPLPSPDVMHVLLHDNSINVTWVDTWQAPPREAPSPAVLEAMGRQSGP